MQLEEGRQQQTSGTQNSVKVGEIQATVNAIHALQGRYAQIQSEEAVLQQQIREMRRWHRKSLEDADLMDLQKRPRALRREEMEVKGQLNQLQEAQL